MKQLFPDMTLAVWSPKGGVGKTTTAVTLARWLRRRKPLLVDLDEQQATAYFSGVLRGVEFTDRLPSVMPPLSILDCPDVFDVARPALSVATLIIVPVACKMLAYAAWVQFYDQLQTSGVNLPIRVLLTMYQTSGAERETAREVRDCMRRDFSDVVFNTVIPQTPLIAVASSRGRTILDEAPDHRTTQLYHQLTEEIVSCHKKLPPDTRAASQKAAT